MRALFWLLAVFASAVALAIIGRGNDGYALFVYPPWRVELSLIFFFVLFAASFGVVYLLARLVHHTFQLPVHVRSYRQRVRSAKARDALLGSAQAYLEGRFARAESDARQAYDGGESRPLAALLAARAAHQLRARDRRDQWLEKSAESGDPLHAARLVTRAELLLEDRDYIGARAVLRDLHGSGPKHIATLRLLLRAEFGARNWEEVLRSPASSPSATRFLRRCRTSTRARRFPSFSRPWRTTRRAWRQGGENCRRATKACRAWPPRPRSTPLRPGARAWRAKSSSARLPMNGCRHW